MTTVDRETNHGKFFNRLLRALIIGLVTGLMFPGPAYSQNLKVATGQVKLKFAPPNGTTCTRKLLITKKIKVGDDQTESEALSAVNTLVFRTSSNGVSITLKPRITAKDRRRLERAQDFAGGLITSSDITMNYDRGGRFISISGLKSAAEALRDGLPAALGPMIDQLLPMEISNFRTKWEHRFHQFTIQNFPIGKFARVNNQVFLGNGQAIDVMSEFGVKEQRVQDGKNIAHLVSGYTSTDPAMGDAMGKSMLAMLIDGMKSLKKMGMKISPQKMDGLINQLEGDFPKFVVNQFWFSNERYLDSSTMITYFETERRVMSMTLTLPNNQGSIKSAVQHRKDYSYDCS